MFGGLTFDKLLLVGVIAVFLLGPEKLPHYAAQLGRLVRQLRDMANGAKDRMRDEMGPDFDDLDWKKLDPRQYDPRRIIREALVEEDPLKTQATDAPAAITRTSPNPNSAYLQRKRAREAGLAVPASGAAAADAGSTGDGTAGAAELAFARAPFDSEAT
jgi:sec-independent protein translocase protein TatB